MTRPMRDETIDFGAALREALDHAAKFCPNCGTGNTLCSVHREDRFRDDVVERLTDEVVYQLADDRSARALAQTDLLEAIEDALLEAIDKIQLDFDEVAKRTLRSTITKTVRKHRGSAW